MLVEPMETGSEVVIVPLVVKCLGKSLLPTVTISGQTVLVKRFYFGDRLTCRTRRLQDFVTFKF